MYYVLYDTGNEVFFSHIADAYCSAVIKSIVNILEEIETMHQNNLLDDNILNHLIKENKITSLKCKLFPTIKCDNKNCMYNNIPVLTSNQIEMFNISMWNMYNLSIKQEAVLKYSRKRLYFQKIIQNYKIKDIHNINHIKTYKDVNNDYLKAYIRETNKLSWKSKNFVYVRAKSNSDFNYFVNNTKLKNVISCDNFQIL